MIKLSLLSILFLSFIGAAIADDTPSNEPIEIIILDTIEINVYSSKGV